jgi:hypothetical protein
VTRISAPGIPIDPHAPLPRAMLAYAAALARYHRHRVFGLEYLARLFEEGRRVVLVSNHVFELADPLIFVAELVRRWGRAPHFIGQENLIFRTPGLREMAMGWGAVPSRHLAEAEKALRDDGLLMLFPGAGREAMMRSFRDEPYRLKWEGRAGFLELALDCDAEIVFVATVGSEEMYYQSRLPAPSMLLRAFSAERYRGARLTFGLLGPHLVPTIFPFPVQLTHHVAPPLDLGDRDVLRGDPTRRAEAHRRIQAECQTFLDGAVRWRDANAPALDRLIRGVQLVAQGLGL